MNYIAGVDPGLTGAIALYDPATSDVQIFDMPTHRITVNGSKKNLLDLYALARWIDLHGHSIKAAWIEEPHAMPGQGVSSSFSFGKSCGIAEMTIASALIPMRLVRPAAWKKAMGLTSDKDASRRRATMLFPQHGALFARAKDDGRAEALLIAVYGSGIK